MHTRARTPTRTHAHTATLRKENAYDVKFTIVTVLQARRSVALSPFTLCRRHRHPSTELFSSSPADTLSPPHSKAPSLPVPAPTALLSVSTAV